MKSRNRGRQERFVQTLWYGDSILALLLTPLALVFRLLVAMRVFAYRQGWLRSERMPVPVVVVGNITAGGTGKTPVVDWLVRAFAAAGRNPGIVSRGYGGSAGQGPLMVTGSTSAADAGDEALLLAKRTQVPVCVGADRVAAAGRLIEAGVDVIVADDGLQHYRLERDVEIVVVDGQRGLGNGYMIPAGPLRESAKRLVDADVVLVNGARRFSADGFASDCAFELRPEDAVSLAGDETRPLAAFRGQRVWAVAGIGNPQRFSDMLERFGIDAEPVEVADHAVVSLGSLERKARRPILMTEKDAVKYPAVEGQDAWYVPVEAEMSPPAEAALLGVIQVIKTL